MITTEESNPCRHPEEGTKCIVEEKLCSEYSKHSSTDKILNKVQSPEKHCFMLQNDKNELLKKKAAFTLAEVLITLSILGVVAAIAIPNIIQQYQKRLTVTKLQKAYASMEKMATNIAVSTGCVGRDVACTGLFEITDVNKFRDKFIELAGITPVKKETGYIGVKALNYNLTKNTSYIDAIVAITKDNIAYSILKKTPRAYSANAQDNIGYQRAIEMIVITNPKKMYAKDGKIKDYTRYTTDLIIGRDIFFFYIHDNFNVTPRLMGSATGEWLLTALDKTNYTKHEYIDKYCNPNNASQSASAGTVCALKIIRDGWKMKY